MFFKLFVFTTFCFAISCCQSIEGVYQSCGLNINCAEKKIINLIDEYDTRPDVDVLGGVLTIQRNGKEIEAPKSENLVTRFIRYLSCHELKINLPEMSEESRRFFTEPRSKKLKKIILPVLLLLKLKAAILIPAVLSAIALIAFKGMGAGFVALMLSAGTAFKSALESHVSSKKVSFEVVPPHWSRAGVAPSGPTFVQEWPIHGYQTLP